MDEAAVKALIDKAIADLEAKLAAVAPPGVEAIVSKIWTDVRQGVVKATKYVGVTLVVAAGLAGAFVAGHVL